jgi:hypothetical protein
LPPNAWNDTEAEDDTRNNNIKHMFQRCVALFLAPGPNTPLIAFASSCRSSKGAITQKAAAAAALKLPGSTSATAAAAAASIRLLPLVFRLLSVLAPADFHTFSAAK